MRCPNCNSENLDESVFCAKCGTQIKESEEKPLPTQTIEAPKEEITTGSTFAGKYQIIEELGQGGMGRVYKALDTTVNEKVALKLIKPEIAVDKKTIERFKNELKFARKIRHKNVCQMYDLNTEEGSYYITMEYVTGQDLKGLIRQSGRLAVETGISITKQICDGLEEAHRLGVVHRDLKPSNIMIDRDGSARIMDFGIARSVERKGLTGAGVMIGTPEYMSPEQVESKETDQRSDIYSLGVILYEMVTGRVPFEGDTPFTVGVKHKSETPTDPKELNAQIPEDLSRVIMKCLEKDKEKRYQDAGEVRAEIARIEEGMPTAVREIPKGKPLTSREITITVGPKKLFIPVLVVMALVIAAVIIWQFMPKKESVAVPSGKPSLAVLYFKNNTGEKSLDHWRTMLSNLLIADLTQSKHIRVLSEDRLFNILSELNQIDAETYTSEVLDQVASQGGVNHILQGAYAKAGDEFRINVMLQDASTSELIGSESVAGVGESSIFTMVDDLTRRIKTNFDLSDEDIASDIDKEVGLVTTNSPEAYRYYVEGIKYDIKGDYRKVIENMEKAVAIDPEFASAYNAMAWSYANMGYFAEERKYLQKAMELSDRLSDREKYLIQGNFYYRSVTTSHKAQDALERLVEIYPNDISGNNLLGILYGRLGEEERAVERYQVCIDNETKDVVIFLNQSSAYRAMGMYDKAAHVIEAYLNNIGSHVMAHRRLAQLHRLQGNFDLALAEVEKAMKLSPTSWQNFLSRGDVFLYMGDLEKAEEDYRKPLEKDEPVAHVSGLVGFATLNLRQGKFQETRAYVKDGLEQAEKLGQNVWLRNWQTYMAYMEIIFGHPDRALQILNEMYNSAVKDENFGQQLTALREMGRAYLEMDDINEAQNIANKLEQKAEDALNKKIIRNYYFIMGLIELKKNNYSQAIKFIQMGLPLLPANSGLHLQFTDFLGLAYYKAGDLENAMRAYEKITSLTTGRIEFADIFVKSFHMLGKIYEDQGIMAKAIENYETFLDLWKDADPGIAEVEDAKKKLVILRSQ
jgi:serine/threonine protein kinase/Flp pilus assembly protein TadD